MAETWPVSIPQKILRDGYNSNDDTQSINSENDIGPQKTRRVVTKGYNNTTGSIFLKDVADVTTMRTFYDVTLAGGTKYFNFNDPSTGTVREFRFAEPPKYAPLGASFVMSFVWKGKPL